MVGQNLHYNRFPKWFFIFQDLSDAKSRYLLRAREPTYLKPNAKPLPKNGKWKQLKSKVPFISYPWFELADIAGRDLGF
jgi:hypothetical protein